MEDLLNQLPSHFEYDYQPPTCQHCGKAPYPHQRPAKKEAALRIWRNHKMGEKGSSWYTPSKWHIQYDMDGSYLGVENESLEVAVKEMLTKLREREVIK